MVSSKYKPQKFPIYAVETELGSSILFNEVTNETENQKIEKNQQAKIQQFEEVNEEGWWHVHFDGPAGK